MTRLKKIFGMLETVPRELRYKTAEEQNEADDLNKQLKPFGFRTGRLAYDWGFRRYREKNNSDDGKPSECNMPETFKSGDLVKIFKSVTDGDVQWQGRIELDFTEYHHGFQAGIALSEWISMFHDHLPARLEKDGEAIYGALMPYCETGTEGVIWAVHEYGKSGYDGLHILEDGDALTVYSNVRDGEVEWQGELDFGPEKVEKLGWTEIMRQTKHLPTEKWQEWSQQNRPAVIIPR